MTRDFNAEIKALQNQLEQVRKEQAEAAEKALFLTYNSVDGFDFGDDFGKDGARMVRVVKNQFRNWPMVFADVNVIDLSQYKYVVMYDKDVVPVSPLVHADTNLIRVVCGCAREGVTEEALQNEGMKHVPVIYGECGGKSTMAALAKRFLETGMLP